MTWYLFDIQGLEIDIWCKSFATLSRICVSNDCSLSCWVVPCCCCWSNASCRFCLFSSSLLNHSCFSSFVLYSFSLLLWTRSAGRWSLYVSNECSYDVYTLMTAWLILHFHEIAVGKKCGSQETGYLSFYVYWNRDCRRLIVLEFIVQVRRFEWHRQLYPMHVNFWQVNVSIL